MDKSPDGSDNEMAAFNSITPFFTFKTAVPLVIECLKDIELFPSLENQNKYQIRWLTQF